MPMETTTFVERPDLCGPQILFTDNMFRNKRYVTLAKLYECLNAHIATGSSIGFIQSFLSIQQRIFDVLASIDQGNVIPEAVIEKTISDIMDIVLVELNVMSLSGISDSNLELSLRYESENYNPYAHVYDRLTSKG